MALIESMILGGVYTFDTIASPVLGIYKDLRLETVKASYQIAATVSDVHNTHAAVKNYTIADETIVLGSIYDEAFFIFSNDKAKIAVSSNYIIEGSVTKKETKIMHIDISNTNSTDIIRVTNLLEGLNLYGAVIDIRVD